MLNTSNGKYETDVQSYILYTLQLEKAIIKCEISDRGFLVWTELRRSEVHAKNRGLIFHSADRTSEVNNRFIVWLN